ncbi:MAG: LOG family protein [Campylobacterales bacterium]
MWATVFGSSKASRDSELYRDSVEVGSFLVESGYNIKCGGYGGVMEGVSVGVKNSGGGCHGIGLEFFEAKRERNIHLSSVEVTLTLIQRVEKLVDDSSLFVVLEGDIGTLNELFFVWCLRYTTIRDDIRICVIGECFEGLRSLKNIDGANFDFLEFYKSVDEFKRALR